MLDKSESKQRLERMAHQLADRARESDADTSGWGQFLDAPAGHAQVGWYGTAAGLLVRSLAGLGKDRLAERAIKRLRNWWEDRNHPGYGATKSTQTARVAFLHLALQTCPHEQARSLEQDVRNELLARRLGDHQWGAWWISPESHDPASRTLPTALALLSLNVCSPTPPDPQQIEAAGHIESMLASEELASVEATTIAAAALATKGRLGRKAQRRLTSLALLRGEPGLAESGVYHYEYEFQDTHERKQGRDYVIIPTALMLTIAAFQKGAPAMLRIAGDSVASALAAQLTRDQPFFRGAPGQRLAMKDQAWAALALDQASAEPPLGRGGRFLYAMRRSRPEGRKVAIFQAVALLTMAAAGLLGPRNLLQKLILTAGGTVVFGLYAGPWFRRLFPHRK